MEVEQEPFHIGFPRIGANSTLGDVSSQFATSLRRIWRFWETTCRIAHQRLFLTIQKRGHLLDTT